MKPQNLTPDLMCVLCIWCLKEGTVSFIMFCCTCYCATQQWHTVKMFYVKWIISSLQQSALIYRMLRQRYTFTLMDSLSRVNCVRVCACMWPQLCMYACAHPNQTEPNQAGPHRAPMWRGREGGGEEKGERPVARRPGWKRSWTGSLVCDLPPSAFQRSSSFPPPCLL